MPGTVQGMRTVELVSRRQAIATLAGGITLIAAPAVVRAQAPLKVTFVQQRGLLYLPVDLMVSGGILQKEADKLAKEFVGPTALAWNPKDPVALAKVLTEAAKTNPNLKFKSAIVDGQVCAQKVTRLTALTSTLGSGVF